MPSTFHPSTASSTDAHHYQPLLLAARQLAQAHHSQYDPSHDFHHLQRVVRTALVIGKSLNAQPQLEHQRRERSETEPEPEPEPVDLVLVELAALFHDLLDSKYLPPNQKGMTAQERLRSFWKENLSGGTAPKEGSTTTTENGAEEESNFSARRQRLVEKIMEHVSYSKEVKRIAQGGVSEWEKGCRELHCVQDADKLDAIGAFGIMRCSAYSAMTNRPLYVHPTNTDDNPQASEDCAIQHFHDKLFKLQGMIKTSKGKEMARKRTELMRVFVRGVEEEWLDGEEEDA